MLLRELYEADKAATLAFGRMNPPTIGHKKLVDVVASQPGDPFLFITQTQKPKTDPLDFQTKLKFATKFFPNVTVGDSEVNTIIKALQKLESMGYTSITYVAGSDRVEDFKNLITKYNGKDYNFNNISVVSAGERDPDADGAEGMSASKMRAAAMSDDFDAFKQGVVDQSVANQLYDAVRKGMGLTEKITKKTPMGDVVKDFYKSDAPQFKGKSKAKKRQMAIAAKLSKNESELVMDKESLIGHLQKEIEKYAREEEDVEKLSYILKQLSGKKIKTRNNRYYTISDEDIQEGIGRVLKGLKGPGYYSLDKDNPDHPADVSDKLRKRLKKKK